MRLECPFLWVFFLKYFLLMWTTFKVVIEFVTILLLLLMVWFFGLKTCGILASWPGIEPIAPAVEGEVSTTGPPGKSSRTSICMCPELWMEKNSNKRCSGICHKGYDKSSSMFQFSPVVDEILSFISVPLPPFNLKDVPVWVTNCMAVLPINKMFISIHFCLRTLNVELIS